MGIDFGALRWCLQKSNPRPENPLYNPVAALLGGTVSTGVHGKGGRRPRRVSVCRTAARPGVPRCIRPTGTKTGPPIDDLAVNLASSAGRAAPGGEWIEGRQAAGRGASASAV